MISTTTHPSSVTLQLGRGNPPTNERPERSKALPPTRLPSTPSTVFIERDDAPTAGDERRPKASCILRRIAISSSLTKDFCPIS